MPRQLEAEAPITQAHQKDDSLAGRDFWRTWDFNLHGMSRGGRDDSLCKTASQVPPIRIEDLFACDKQIHKFEATALRKPFTHLSSHIVPV